MNFNTKNNTGIIYGTQSNGKEPPYNQRNSFESKNIHKNHGSHSSFIKSGATTKNESIRKPSISSSYIYEDDKLLLYGSPISVSKKNNLSYVPKTPSPDKKKYTHFKHSPRKSNHKVNYPSDSDSNDWIKSFINKEDSPENKMPKATNSSKHRETENFDEPPNNSDDDISFILAQGSSCVSEDSTEDIINRMRDKFLKLGKLLGANVNI